MTYKIIKGNSINYIESDLKYHSEQYENFTIHGGINNYGGYFTVLVSYKERYEN